MKKRTIIPVVIWFLWLLCLAPAAGQPAPLKIGISKASPNYLHWLKNSDPSLHTVNFYGMTAAEAVRHLRQCNGLLLTGGEDIFPGRYGKEYDTVRCTEIDPYRDSLEFALIEKALELKIPVLGICRGHQILNVYLGGSLIVDIPSDRGTKVIHQCDDYLNCFHSVTVTGKTLLAEICKCDSAGVTTNHHQAIDRLSPLLKINAVSDDGLAESIEWLEPANKSFLLGVQWHPERMDFVNPLSSRIAREFLMQSAKYMYHNQQSIRK
jgi:putative glutamine amidotransferase